METITTPKKRIEVVDALRGFALMGILILHCIEHFGSTKFVGEATPVVQWLDIAANDVIRFIFSYKSYAIFSTLFGLSFFIQMESQADKGVDFRLRFAWRLVLLFVIGYFNGLFYSDEILLVYAIAGLAMIPLYKLPTRWLIPLCLLFLFQIPTIIYMIVASFDAELGAYIPESRTYLGTVYRMVRRVTTDGSFLEVMSVNSWEGQFGTVLSFLSRSVNGLRLLGLFMAGMLIGRMGIHKDEQKMIRYAGRLILFGLPFFAVFFCVGKILPVLDIQVAYIAQTLPSLIATYSSLGIMCMIIGIFVLSYFRLGARDVLNRLAPVGRMSLTNYVMQSVMGFFVFFGCGLALAPVCGYGLTLLISLPLCAFQIWFSTWWLRRYHYGPVEYLWRAATWMSFANTPFKKR